MSGVYIHIPFCRQACVYCNFYFKTGNKQAEPLGQAILHEIDLKLKQAPFKLETLYFGGGSPSFVNPNIIAQIINKLKSSFGAEIIKELTLEANPDDMTDDKLSAWRSAGVNRLSVGIQSFHDAHLKWMNRAHTAAEAVSALQRASAYGFELSLDLIFGIPDCSDEEWLENLKKACSFDVVHLSCYGLTLEENTPWKKLIERQRAEAPDEEVSSRQFDMGMQFLTSQGWHHYEISNYCRPGKEAIHNTAYWQNKPYLGFGPSAHGYDGRRRTWNVADLKAYTESIEKGIIPESEELLSEENKYNEYIMTGLRTSRGILVNQLKQSVCFPIDFHEKVSEFINQGFLQYDEHAYRLTDAGKHFADGIASALFVTQA